jgi:hypothetical protein
MNVTTFASQNLKRVQLNARDIEQACVTFILDQRPELVQTPHAFTLVRDLADAIVEFDAKVITPEKRKAEHV